MYFSPDSNNVAWVFNLGNSTPLDLATTIFSIPFVKMIVFSGLLTYLTLGIFVFHGEKTFSTIYTIYFLIGTIVVSSLFELNSRYFFSYMTPIAFFGLFISEHVEARGYPLRYGRSFLKHRQHQIN
jgi:hypothetical protein